MSHRNAGDLVRELEVGDHVQARKIAEIIQRVRPHVILINEFDYDQEGRAAQLFLTNYLSVSQNGQEPLVYSYHYFAPVNSGVPSSLDLNKDGKTGGPADAYGYGRFPGQYGMVVYSVFPINSSSVRTFQNFHWHDMPAAELPMNPDGDTPYYDETDMQTFRLSSKSHWDVPIRVNNQTIHLLACHPTPPVFDGTEDRNGCRNHDEIRFWADYIEPERNDYIYDDKGQRGGLPAGTHFVIAGDLNADPHDGASRNKAILQLLDHPLINAAALPRSRANHSMTPSSYHAPFSTLATSTSWDSPAVR